MPNVKIKFPSGTYEGPEGIELPKTVNTPEEIENYLKAHKNPEANGRTPTLDPSDLDHATELAAFFEDTRKIDLPDNILTNKDFTAWLLFPSGFWTNDDGLKIPDTVNTPEEIDAYLKAHENSQEDGKPTPDPVDMDHVLERIAHIEDGYGLEIPDDITTENDLIYWLVSRIAPRGPKNIMRRDVTVSGNELNYPSGTWTNDEGIEIPNTVNTPEEIENYLKAHLKPQGTLVPTLDPYDGDHITEIIAYLEDHHSPDIPDHIHTAPELEEWARATYGKIWGPEAPVKHPSIPTTPNIIHNRSENEYAAFGAIAGLIMGVICMAGISGFLGALCLHWRKQKVQSMREKSSGQERDTFDEGMAA